MGGAHVVMILGARLRTSRRTAYYLWSEVVIDEVLYNGEDDNYNIFGLETLLARPLKLNRLKGFRAFVRDNGNFAFGLQSMQHNDFFKDTLLPLVQNYLLTQTMRYSSYLERITEREDRSLSRYL